jgi:hypothetical protein
MWLAWEVSEVCRSEKLGGRESSIQRSLFQTQWTRLVAKPRHRWKILTSFFIKFDVAGGIDLVEGACKIRMNVHSLCYVESLCTCATVCFTRRQCCGLDNQGIIH